MSPPISVLPVGPVKKRVKTRKVKSGDDLGKQKAERMGVLVIVVFWHCTFFSGNGGRQNMRKLIFVRFHPKLMFLTYVFEKYETFQNLSTRRMSELNKDPWINKQMVAAEDGAADKTAFSTDDVSREDYTREVRLITEAWERSSKGAGRAQTLRDALTPFYVPDDHLYYDIYFHALTFLRSCTH